MGVRSIRFPETASIGIKPVSVEGYRTADKAGYHFCHEEEAAIGNTGS